MVQLTGRTELLETASAPQMKLREAAQGALCQPLELTQV